MRRNDALYIAALASLGVHAAVKTAHVEPWSGADIFWAIVAIICFYLILREWPDDEDLA